MGATLGASVVAAKAGRAAHNAREIVVRVRRIGLIVLIIM
jgi:hypothetical protein